MTSRPVPEPGQIGLALTQARHADAAQLLEAWLAAHPDDADGWFNLGFCRRHLLDADGAIAAYGRALAAGISEPEQVHVNIAAIQAEVLQDVAAARASLRQALSLQPGFALAWQNLGQLEEDVGDAAAARAAYEGAGRHAPDLGRPPARLAAIDVFEGRPADALARVEAAGARAGSHDDLVELAFAAANALDAMGRHDEAFDQLMDANELQKHTGKLRHSQADVEAQVNAMIQLFPAEPLPPARDHGIRPIFICGLFRSGSTLLESLLSRELGITMGGELAYTPWFMQQHGHAITPATRDDMAARFAEGYAGFARRVLGDVPRFTDKRMDNFLFLGLIKRAFPEALIIHTMRNPIDNFLSMFFLPFADGLTYANDLDDMLHYYRQYRRLMAHWEQCFGSDILTLRYDTLVQQAEAVLAGLKVKLGAAAAAPANSQIIRTASVWQVRQPVHARSSGRWRNYAAQVGELADLLRREFPDISQ